MDDYIVSYAQNREDIILSGFFRDIKNGFYIDVGANHPVALSITKYFYDRGWHGINIEPNRRLYTELRQHRQRDINLNIGAANKAGELVLREYPGGDGLSTFSKETQAEYQKSDSVYRKNTEKYKEHTIQVKTLAQICEEQNVEIIHFMNIDVEGFEYNVIEGNDWRRFRPQVICIEANHIVHDWRPLLDKADYSLAFFDGLNNYYVADEHKELKEQFSYVNTVLLGVPIINFVFESLIKESSVKLVQAENRLVRQRLVEENLRGEIFHLQEIQRNNKRLRMLVKQIVETMHTIILLHIEKLNRPRTKQRPGLTVQEDISAEALIRELKIYDLQFYSAIDTSPPLLYAIIHAIYLTTYTGAKRLTKSALRSVRRRKG